ncbi:MAG: DUF968 domain-containing protein [Candidatus Binatia bacterium]
MMPSIPKPRTYRSDSYLRFVRQHPCIVSECSEPSEAHHAGGIVSGRGTGQKGSDYQCIPACRAHHHFYHTMGRMNFEHRFKVDVRATIIAMLEKYVEMLERPFSPEQM